MIPFVDLQIQKERIAKEVRDRIEKVMAHGKFIMGPEVAELEGQLAAFSEVKHCVGVGNGTDALQLAVMALNIQAGDEVVVPDFSFFGTAEVLSLLGVHPVFADIDPKTYNLDPESLEEAISPRTKAVVVVDLYGQCANYTKISAIAKKHNIKVIVDGAQSFGASHGGCLAGGFGDITTTSFFPTKPLGCYGDGGAILTNSDESAEIIKQLRTHGQNGRYNHVRIGVNSRLDSIQAAVLLSKLPLFKEELALRNTVAERYQAMLGDHFAMPTIEEGNKSAWAQFTLEADARDRFREILTEMNIATAVHYPKPISLQPAYASLKNKSVCPVAKKASTRVISIPMHPYLTESVQSQIADALIGAKKKIEKVT